MAIALVFTIIIGICASAFFYVFAKLKAAQNEANFLREEKKKSEEKIENLQQKNLEFEKKNELLKQEQNQLEKQKQEWSKDKEAMLLQLSSDLMKKNHEQQNQISLQQQENIKKVTENLFKNFENVTAKMVSLNDDVKKSSEMISLTRQALLSPGAAGRTAEITLENILKTSGLKEKADLNSVGDYILQSHFSGVTNASEHEAKRPDAVLFFPNDQISIIDSKSSPHFLDLESARQAGDFEQEKVILGKIKEAFRKHLESLKRKDYAKFLFEEMRSKNSSDYRIMIIMFLQTEKMMEIVRETDPNFEQRALEAGVVVASPIGLINFLSQARVVIDRVKQEKNIENLKVEVRRLLDNVAVIFKESKELGKALNKASGMHNKMTKTLNRGVFAAVRNIAELGIEGKKSAEMQLLEEYDENDESGE
ncbi:MAG: DNA recombination protein RmuC [Rickettsiales bacterium]|nr:DNA recombination protein RmuC [Rickettsiales bacterium]